MSASMSPTLLPDMCSAIERFAATVDLPTPPFPLATAITCFTPGSDSFGGICGFIRSLFSLCVLFAQLAEEFERVNSGVVAVVPLDLIRVVAHGLHRDRCRRTRGDFLRRQDAERVSRFRPFFHARRARAVGAQFLPRH